MTSSGPSEEGVVVGPGSPEKGRMKNRKAGNKVVGWILVVTPASWLDS